MVADASRVAGAPVVLSTRPVPRRGLCPAVPPLLHGPLRLCARSPGCRGRTTEMGLRSGRGVTQLGRQSQTQVPVTHAREQTFLGHEHRGQGHQ